MVSSPMYDRVMRFANSAPDNEKLYGWDDEHAAALRAIRNASESVEHFRDHQGFTGQAGEAMTGEATRALKRFSGHRNYFLTGAAYYVEARRAIMLAAEEARQLSPTLLDPMTEALRGATSVVVPIATTSGLPGQFVNSLAVLGRTYVDAVEAQANAQREAKATEIIERLESTLGSLRGKLEAHVDKGPDSGSGSGSDRWEPIPEMPADAADALRKGHVVISPYEGGAYGRSRSDAFGNAGLRGSDSGLYPGGYNEGGEIDQRVLHSPRVPSRYFPEGDVGSRTNPVTDPQDLMDLDLLHTRVDGDRHRNGVIGGHTPAPPVDRDHPLWGINTARASDAHSSARLGGVGLLGAGALGVRGAARMGAGDLGALVRTSMSGLGGAGSAAGSAPLRVGSYGGRGMATYTPPGAVGTSVSSGASGRASGSQGGYMGGASGSAGAKEEKRARRRKYEAFRVEDEDEDALPRGYVNPLSQMSGSDKTITPARRKDDGWDLNQW